jgi:hypothetical protein
MSSQNPPRSAIDLARPGAPNNLIPSRYSLSNYQRYECFIKDFLASYPNPIDFTPNDVSVETFSKCFRNACKSAIAYRWSTADIDIERLNAVWPATVVRTNPTHVRVGPRDSPSVPDAGKSVLAASFDVEASESLCVKAAIVLLAYGKLTVPVLLHGDPSEALEYIARNSYDVSLSPAPEAGPESFRML